MDYQHCDWYNHLLTRKCNCGGDGEMLVDFVSDFVVRCAKCRLGTHAYMRPEEAAKHWNDGDDIMEEPLHIFWDDPEGVLRGKLLAIHIADDEFEPVTQQSIHFMRAILEYTDKMLCVEHDEQAIDIKEISSFNPKVYRYVIRPVGDEEICFDSITLANEETVAQLEYRWNGSRLFITAERDHLVLARDGGSLVVDQ